MRKAPRDVATSRRAFQDSSLLRFIQRRDQGIAVDLGDLFEQIRLEMTADHRGGSQHVLCFRRHALYPALQHDAHRVGDLDRIELEIARPPVARVEQPSLFVQVPEQLDDEERIAACVVGELPHDSGWSG